MVHAERGIEKSVPGERSKKKVAGTKREKAGNKVENLNDAVESVMLLKKLLISGERRMRRYAELIDV